ncbi:hypothetical protein ZEAMMB73_Zm00001d013790 [Zea mays]|uniref:Uncharacterized protein n=1 Tax=Zea mays TaxID=4577 RepID=A0A1D6GM37_MAIZE|nr:hypothetical protein ZEAMMB73_Zm00001d013790 [Zea mays]
MPGKESAPPFDSPTPRWPPPPPLTTPRWPRLLCLLCCVSHSRRCPPPQPAPPPPRGRRLPSSLPHRFPTPFHRASPGSAPKTPPRCPRFLPPTPVACLTPRHGFGMVNPSLRPRIPQPMPPSSPPPLCTTLPPQPAAEVQRQVAKWRRQSPISSTVGSRCQIQVSSHAHQRPDPRRRRPSQPPPPGHDA